MSLHKIYYSSSKGCAVHFSETNTRFIEFYLLRFSKKHANSKVQKSLSQFRFLLLSVIIMISSNEPWNTETHKTDQNPPITNHKPWSFEPVKVKFCFLRGPLRWLTAAKNAIASWLLNFRIRMFVKSAVTDLFLDYKLFFLNIKYYYHFPMVFFRIVTTCRHAPWLDGIWF